MSATSTGSRPVSQFRQGGFRVDGQTAFLTAVDPATVDQVATLELSPEAIQGLEDGKIVVFDDVMKDEGWKVGDTIATEFATVGKAPLVIGGTFSENSLLGTNYVVSLDTYDQYFQQQLDAFVMVKLEPGADAATVQASVVAATSEFGNVEVQDQTAFRDQQAGFIDQLLGLISALLAFAILIALFGIVNTLGLSIFERTRELGLLRAVGMSRKQIKRMIRWESVIISIIGALLGVVIGVFFGFALQQALASEGVTELVIPVGTLVDLRGLRRAGRRAGRHLAGAPRGQAGRAGVDLVRVGRRPADIMARMPHDEARRRVRDRPPRRGADRLGAAPGGDRGAGRR